MPNKVNLALYHFEYETSDHLGSVQSIKLFWNTSINNKKGKINLTFTHSGSRPLLRISQNAAADTIRQILLDQFMYGCIGDYRAQLFSHTVNLLRNPLFDRNYYHIIQGFLGKTHIISIQGANSGPMKQLVCNVDLRDNRARNRFSILDLGSGKNFYSYQAWTPATPLTKQAEALFGPKIRPLFDHVHNIYGESDKQIRSSLALSVVLEQALAKHL